MTSEAYWLNKQSREFLSRGYLAEGQTAEDRIRKIAETAEKYLKKCVKTTSDKRKFSGFANKFERYMLNGWISLASPIWSNYGTKRGLPISCNGSYVDDTIEGILATTSEIGIMTKLGAGTSAYYGAVRPRGTEISTGGTTDGPVHFMELVDTVVNVISQSNVRRGSCAVYLDVEHPDIKEFLRIREEGHEIQHLSMGVCVSDQWLEEMIEGDTKKRKIWAAIIQKRFETGYPYIFFTDNVNKYKPAWYSKMKIHASNLCSEIALPSSSTESFVCCLSSLNVLHYDEWKDTDVVETLTYFLDTVIEEYVQKTCGVVYMEKAHNFAKNHRAIGIGILGWHSYLQSKMIAIESEEARALNIDIHNFINSHSWEASAKLAQLLGPAPVVQSGVQRNATRMATAPTTSSSFILGQVSPSREPLNSNYFVKDLQKGKYTYKNPYLKKLLKQYQKDDKETWESILLAGGSVQHLEFLTEHEKNVFKTFGEISQFELIMQAADAQKFIDQAQSLNLMIHPDTPVKDVNKLLIEAWKLGIKTLYYQRSTNPNQALARELVSCAACEV